MVPHALRNVPAYPACETARLARNPLLFASFADSSGQWPAEVYMLHVSPAIFQAKKSPARGRATIQKA